MAVQITRPELLAEYHAIHKDPARTYVVPESIPPLVTTDADCVRLVTTAVELGRDDFSPSEIAQTATLLTAGDIEPSRARRSLVSSRKLLHHVLGTVSEAAKELPPQLTELNKAMGNVNDGIAARDGNLYKEIARMRVAAERVEPTIWDIITPCSADNFEDGRMDIEGGLLILIEGIRLQFKDMHERRKQVRNLASLYLTAAMHEEDFDSPIVAAAFALQKANNILGQSLGAQRDEPLLVAPGAVQDILGQYLDARREVAFLNF